jgi:hypothetical protein
MRSILSLQNIVRAELGKSQQLDQVIDRYSLIKNFEQLHDFKIAPLYLNQYVNEVLTEFIPEGLDAFSIDSTFSARGLGIDVYNGFSSALSPIEKLKYACSIDYKYYDFVFYGMYKKSKKLILKLNYSVPRTPALYYICNYHLHYFNVCSSWGLNMNYINIKKDRCYFNGDDCCRYIVDIDN